MMAQDHPISPVTVRDILYVAFKHKFQVLAIFALSVLGALAWLIITAPTYEAETKILVQLGKEKSESLDASMSKPNVVFAARSEDIRDEIEILTDKNAIYAVMPQLQDWLAKAPKPPQTLLRKIRTWMSEAFGAVKEVAMMPFYAVGLAVKLDPDQKFALALQAALKADLIEQTDVMRVKVGWSNPQFAAFAANAFANEYVKRRMDVFAMSGVHRFYSDQIELYRNKLQTLEQQIEEYRKARGISNLELQRELLLREISQLGRDMEQANGALDEMKVKLETLSRTFHHSEDWLETPMVGEVIPNMVSLDKQYFDALAERNRLLETETLKSRSVQALKAQMTKTRAQKFQSLEAFIQAQTQGILKRRELGVAALAGKRNSLAQLDEDARELRELERRRTLAEHDYTEYARKAEDFRISEALNQERITSVKILGTALPPEKPSKPWVTITLALAAFLGAFLGFAYATLAEFFDHTFRSKEELESVLHVPLLATVPEMGADRPPRSAAAL